VTPPGSTTAAPVTTGVLPTGKVGTYKLTLTAIDNGGNKTVVTSSYTVVYKICLQYSSSTASLLKGTTTLKLEVCDDHDKNVSSTSHLEVALKVDGTMSPSTNVVSGKSYGYQFWYSSTTAMYTYNLNTATISGMKIGAHKLAFTVDGVAASVYIAPFTLK
jgi:PKD repeat protein